MPSFPSSFDAIEAQRREIVAALDALDDAARMGKAKLSDWSPLQIAEHLVIGDETVGSGEWATSQAKGGKLPRHRRAVFALISWALRRDITLPLPGAQFEPRGATPWPELRARWEAARAGMRASLETPNEERSFFHPVIGALSGAEMLRLSEVHNAYHGRQLQGVLRGL